MDKLDPKTDGASQDIVADNIDKLRELFPDAFTEGADADGMTFGSSATIALVCWREPVIVERLDLLVYSNPIPSKRLARLLEMETDAAYTPQAIAWQPAAAAICAYIRAVVRFYACVAKAEPRTHGTLRAWKQSWQAREAK